jgi:hypothetical protein
MELSSCWNRFTVASSASSERGMRRAQQLPVGTTQLRRGWTVVKVVPTSDVRVDALASSKPGPSILDGPDPTCDNKLILIVNADDLAPLEIRTLTQCRRKAFCQSRRRRHFAWQVLA